MKIEPKYKMDSFIVREDILYTTIELLKEGKL